MKSEHEHDATQRLIDQHFSGRISPESEGRMRDALVTCPTCNGYYERHLILTRLDPHALDPRIRLARGLGLGGPRSWRRVWTGVAALGVTAFALLVVVPRLAGGLASTRPSAFGARGSADATVRLFVHRLSKNRPPERLGATMAATDELAFAYQNPDSFSHLMVFAVDSAKRVYWYHPAWNDPTQRPMALAILSGTQTHELPEAISHKLPLGSLHIFGVFTHRELNVMDVEKAVSTMQVGATQVPLPDTVQIVESVEVEP